MMVHENMLHIERLLAEVRRLQKTSQQLIQEMRIDVSAVKILVAGWDLENRLVEAIVQQAHDDELPYEVAVDLLKSFITAENKAVAAFQRAQIEERREVTKGGVLN